jgi:hypothetical protein
MCNICWQHLLAFVQHYVHHAHHLPRAGQILIRIVRP